jgi:hypothetical protein
VLLASLLLLLLLVGFTHFKIGSVLPIYHGTVVFLTPYTCFKLFFLPESSFKTLSSSEVLITSHCQPLLFLLAVFPPSSSSLQSLLLLSKKE